MVFEWPWAFLLLPLPILIRYGLPVFRQRALAIRIPFFDLAAKVSGAKVGAGSQVRQQPSIEVLFASVIWVALVVALAAPVKLGAVHTEDVSSRDIMLAIDLSGSMAEKDFPDERGERITRLDAVKDVVARYVDARQHDRIGLIVFGTRAYLQVPFTRDLDSAVEILRETQVSMAGPHTAIGDALGLSIQHFESSKVEDRVLILLTDGADTGSRMSPLNAAHIAAEEGVKIFSIGIGDEHGEGQYRVDFDTLQKMADITNGRFYRAEDSDTLQKVYDEIDRIAASTSTRTVSRPRQSLVPHALIVALVLFIVGFANANFRVRSRGHEHV